jgi:hypothetical protein
MSNFEEKRLAKAYAIASDNYAALIRNIRVDLVGEEYQRVKAHVAEARGVCLEAQLALDEHLPTKC